MAHWIFHITRGLSHQMIPNVDLSLLLDRNTTSHGQLLLNFYVLGQESSHNLCPGLLSDPPNLIIMAVFEKAT